MQLHFLLFLTLLSSPQIHGGALASDEGKWTHGYNLEVDHGVKFRWRNSREIESSDEQYWLIMEFSARATGYVGVCFSPHGGMDGGDMAIVFKVSDGTPKILDFYGVGNVQDFQQDYTLLDYETKNGWTTFSFKRPWDTCDPKDMVITNDTMRLIWAYSDSKPFIQGEHFQASYHGPAKRGTKSITVADGGVIPPFPDEKPELYPGVKMWDFRMNKAKVEPHNTTYYCKMVKFTENTRKKHHMIGWRPLIQKENLNNVHHIIAFECRVPAEQVALFDEYIASHPGATCYTPNMPAPWGKNCAGFLLSWVVGSEGELLPKHVGAPLGQEHGGATYFMVEMHYENAEGQTKTDSSGIRIFYTDQLREVDGGVMLIGYRHTPFLLIPPRQDNFVINGVCGSECTSKMIPPTGIRIVNTIVHMHVVGDKIRLRHIRNGVELPIIAEDNYYDFNYQQSRTLKDELVILPGDELLAECEYKTKDNERYVIGGLATHQEMCQIVFFYYPRLPLTQCTSQYEFHNFFKGLAIDTVAGDVLKPLHMSYDPDLLPPEDRERDLGDDAKELEAIEEGISFKSVFNYMNITGPHNLRGKTVGKFLEETRWTNERGKELEKFWKDGKHYQFCSKRDLKRVVLDKHIINYPKITHPIRYEKSVFCRASFSSSPFTIERLAMGFILAVMLIVVVICANSRKFLSK